MHHVISPAKLEGQALMDRMNALLDTAQPGQPLTEANQARMHVIEELAKGRLVDWRGVLQAFPHTGTLTDLVNTTGSALLIIGLALLLTRVATRAWTIACGAGAMTLTLYVFHVVNTDARLPWFEFIDTHPLRWHVAVLTLIGVAFALAMRSGPLESLVTRVSKSVAQRF